VVGIRACGLPRYIWDVHQIGKRFLFFLALRGTRSILRGVGRSISLTHTRLYPLGVTGHPRKLGQIHHDLFYMMSVRTKAGSRGLIVGYRRPSQSVVGSGNWEMWPRHEAIRH
jgi:hypothetical protein